MNKYLSQGLQYIFIVWEEKLFWSQFFSFISFFFFSSFIVHICIYIIISWNWIPINDDHEWCVLAGDGFRASKSNGHEIGRSPYLLKTQIFMGTFQGRTAAIMWLYHYNIVYRWDLQRKQNFSYPKNLISSPYNCHCIAPPTWCGTSASLF